MKIFGKEFNFKKYLFYKYQDGMVVTKVILGIKFSYSRGIYYQHFIASSTVYDRSHNNFRLEISGN